MLAAFESRGKQLLKTYILQLLRNFIEKSYFTYKYSKIVTVST